jgi:DNA replication protein DnaC
LPDGDAEAYTVRRALKIARVPELYMEADWSKVRSPAVKDWALGVHARTQKRSEPGPLNHHLLGHGLLVMGPTGTGKSSAAALVARDTLAAGRSVAWRYVPDLLDTLTSNPKERQAEIKRLSAVDVLIMDDFGVRDMADWEIGYLDQIVEARYRIRRPIVVTTNLTREHLMADHRLGRMIDRWRERTASNIVVLAGESMRTNGERKS